MPDDPVTPLPASTVLLLRDGADGLEVFMVRRATKMDFAAGALVFPGGKVDPADQAASLRARCAGAEGLDDFNLALMVAAVRETFEECGVLLARPRGTPDFVSVERLQDLESRYRDPLMRDEVGIDEMAEAEDLELACDLLVHYAHWITPVIRPKRFDTHFFLAPAPADHVARHDGSESLDSLWARPQQVFEDFIGGTHQVMFPTYCNLHKLDESRTVTEALDRARGEQVVCVLGQREKGPDGRMQMILPRDAGYDITEVPDPSDPSGKRNVVQR
ncbi:MAG: NUDIX domain-containing protein [Alphaproteobacteria bacterium]|nr:NUDIX domain-containing protein [Alphaproteobacteria bacterium]